MQKCGDDERVYVYGTVLPADADRPFRMWYMRYPDHVLYAESEDGIRWVRPDLGKVEIAGNTANNLLPVSFHSPSVIRDPFDPDPSAHYKMLGVSRAPESRGYCVAQSSDGLGWQFDAGNPTLPGGDTCSLARGPGTGEYFAFHKRYHKHRGHDRRLVYVSASPDFRNWSEPTLAVAPDELDDQQTRDEGGICSQFYNMSAFRSGGMWLGLVTHFRYSGHHARPGRNRAPTTDRSMPSSYTAGMATVGHDSRTDPP